MHPDRKERLPEDQTTVAASQNVVRDQRSASETARTGSATVQVSWRQLGAGRQSEKGACVSNSPARWPVASWCPGRQPQSAAREVPPGHERPSEVSVQQGQIQLAKSEVWKYQLPVSSEFTIGKSIPTSEFYRSILTTRCK